MIKVNRKIDIEPGFDMGLIAPPERLIFFDIETTGLKAGQSSLYLIGTVDFHEGLWWLSQFFAEDPSEEPALLSAFSDIISEKKKGQDHVILVSFNGDTFDIPYIREVERQYGKPSSFRDTVSLDLLKEIRPFKKLTGLPNLRLKTVEKLFGVMREDVYSGGELIYVYEEYLRLSHILKGGCEDTELNEALRNKCLDCLLLHNAEDIADMPLCMGILSYRLLKDGEFTLRKAEVTKDPVSGGEIYDAVFSLKAPLPKGVYYEDENFVLSVSEDGSSLMEVTARLVNTEMRYYFQDFKNYYYLPFEDYAIHKSVGEFVDRKNRRQATAQTCYTKKEGLFIPEPEPVFTPVFYRTYKGMKYAEFCEEMLKDTGKIKEYVLSVLDMSINAGYN
ncbi:MAG: ribonuclease H-like domain-containing protein [Lachnospiraceae bacterium]|nr:ribonuclease H-like domain-containing protein [Lachnospiraceae bacterium]